MNLVAVRRLPFLLIGLFCVGLLGFGYFLQFQLGLDPCPMCIFQRLCYMGVGAVALVAALHGSRHLFRTLYALLALLLALIGAGIAGRQTWLQHLPPDQVPECGPGLEFMLEQYPLWDTVKKSLIGTGDCANVEWQFLSLSIAEWSLVCFLLIALWLILILRHPPTRPYLDRFT